MPRHLSLTHLHDGGGSGGADARARRQRRERGDDASASSPVPCLPAPWQQRGQSKRHSAMRTATEQAMMPRHHHLSLACLRDGDGGSSGGAQANNHKVSIAT